MNERLVKLWNESGSRYHFQIEMMPAHIRKEGKMITFKPGETLITKGDFPDYVYFIISGTVQGRRDYPDGNSYQYFTLDEYDCIVGALEILAKCPMSAASIVAATEVTALQLPSDIAYCYFIEDANADLLKSYLHTISLLLYTRSCSDGLLYYVKGIDRVMVFLSKYYAIHSVSGENITVDSDYQSISSSTGLSVRTVGRCVQKLKKEGLISMAGKHINISYKQFCGIRKRSEETVSDELLKSYW